ADLGPPPRRGRSVRRRWSRRGVPVRGRARLGRRRGDRGTRGRDRGRVRASAPWRQWGVDLEAEAVEQMRNACTLPVAVRGALMPDAHVGYGLPIGGVLATSEAVIPYAVGVDIACRVKLSVYDLPPSTIESGCERLKKAIATETRFGVGSTFKNRREHDVL